MKKFVAIFVLILMSVGIANADVNEGLIAQWSFDECNGTDDTGNGYNGTLSGSPLCVNGIQGKALNFDATDDHLRLSKSLDSNSIKSLSFWINSKGPDGKNDAGMVLAKYSWFGRRSFLIYSHDGDTSKIIARFYSDGVSYDGDVIHSYYENPESLDPDKYSIINNTILETDIWKHVVVNITETELEIWIDGKITNKVKRDYQQYFNSSEPTYIGNAFYIGSDFTYDFRLNGSLDDFRVYDRSLSESEIQQLAQRKLSIHPDKGGDTGSVTVKLYGDGFDEGASVKLVKDGEPDIVGNIVSVEEQGTAISTTFDLNGKTKGLWDVVVTNPDGTTFTIQEGFTIEEGRAAQVWVDIIGRDVIRPGREQSFSVLYSCA